MTETVVIKGRRDFYKLFSLMERGIKDISIALHLETSSLAPLDILIITQFLIVQNQRNCNLTMTCNDNIREYVKEIKLVDFVKTNTHRPTTIRAIPSVTAMPIRRVEAEKMFYYINETKKYFKTFCSSKDLAMLEQCISELINNVYDHSFSKIGAYVFCQYYSNANEIKIAVSDYGIGIPASVNTYLLQKEESTLAEVDCIKWAIEENKSTHSIPQNAGKGLDIINSFITKNKGSWLLLSAGAYLQGKDGQNEFSKNFIYGFKGTAVQIDIKIDNLVDVDIIKDLDWDL